MKESVTLELVELLNKVIDTAIELTDANFGNIQLIDADGRLRIIAHRHFPDWWLEYWDATEV